MYKDPTEFRKRFAAWKNGKKPYENGLPKYLDGKDWQWDTFNYKIPYIPEKSIKLTNAGLATGARISTNMLDSLANTAEEIGLPIQTAIGLATKESTLGNPTDDRSMRTLLSAKHREDLEHELWKRGIRGKDQYGQHLVPDDAKTFYWDQLSLINYYNGEHHLSDIFNRKENVNNLPSTLKKGLLFYKDHPDRYNPGQKNYQRLVDKRGAEVMGSPEVLKWLKERNIKKAVGNFNRINPLLKESKFNLTRYQNGKETGEYSLPRFATGTSGWEDTEQQKAVQEWEEDWKTRTTTAGKSKVLQQWNANGSRPKPESSEEYTKRRINEETKRTWLSDAADISHAVGETALAIDPKTAIPYFGAKVGTDILNGTVGTHTVLDAITPFGAWGANYINPNSLLNRNIRTALYNNKIPYGYNILDINILKSFIEGSIEALAGREIKQLAKPKWFGKSGNILGNTTEASSKPLTQMQENHRAAAWARYLGLNDNLQGVGYIPSRLGWVTKQHDPYFKKAYADAVNDQLKFSGKLKGSISDKSIYNTAGAMGYEVDPATNVARVFDIWDLLPFKKLNIPGIKNFEASLLVPGAKPFNFEMFVDLTR